MKKEKTFIQVFIKDKKELEKLRDKHGLASIAVALGKLLKGSL